MTVTEARVLKTRLETELLALIRKFQSDSGFEVTGIAYNRVMARNCFGEPVPLTEDLHVEASL